MRRRASGPLFLLKNTRQSLPRSCSRAARRKIWPLYAKRSTTPAGWAGACRYCCVRFIKRPWRRQTGVSRDVYVRFCAALDVHFQSFESLRYAFFILRLEHSALSTELSGFKSFDKI